MDHNDATVPAEEMSRILLAEKKQTETTNVWLRGTTPAGKHQV